MLPVQPVATRVVVQLLQRLVAEHRLVLTRTTFLLLWQELRSEASKLHLRFVRIEAEREKNRLCLTRCAGGTLEIVTLVS